MTDDDWVDDEDLLIEAARYAVKQTVSRNRFMSLAKKAWFQAAAEAGIKQTSWNRARVREYWRPEKRRTSRST